jgi:hypothetical protein
MLIDALSALMVVIIFAVLLHVFGLVDRASEVLSIGRRAAATLRDPTLSDADKERQMQQSSLKLFRLLAVLVIGSAAALLTPLALIWLADFVGLLSFGSVLDMFLRWDFIIGGTIIGIASYVASVRWLKRSS